MGRLLTRVAAGALIVLGLEAEGHACSWARDGTRSIFTIDRRKGLVRRIEVPVVTAADPGTALLFR